MQNKTCARCTASKPTSSFTRRTASPDGFAAACADCLREAKRLAYWAKDRESTIARVTRNKQERFARDPAYKRAAVLWGSTKRRTKIPPWVSITDFVPICRVAITLGPDFEIDHVIPINGALVSGLHVPENLQVVLRTTNRLKHNNSVL